MSNQWQNGVFGCFNNIGLCVITFFVLYYTFDKNAEALGEDCVMCGALACLCPELAWGAGLVLRTRLREKRDIEGNLTMDLLLTALCGYCTLCQEAQEISVMQGGGMVAEPQKIDRA